MNQTLRHPQILERARRDGNVTVDGLAKDLGVTLQTIRRDLAELAEAGLLDRVHGGAILPSGTSNIHYEERRALHSDAKQRIARATAARIPNDITLCLNIGTTTEAVAHELLHHTDLRVVTNNVNVAQILAPNPNCETVLTGGTLRHADSGLVGPLAVRSIRQFKFDLAIIGCSAVDADGDMLDFDMAEVKVSQAILAQSRMSWAVVDQSKLNRSAPLRIASLGDLDALLTDVALPADLSRACRDWETDIIIA